MLGRYSLSNDPFFRELEQRLPRMLGTGGENGDSTIGGGYCPVNISQDKDRYFIQALVPGTTADRLELNWQGNSLTIRGSVAAQAPEGATVVWNEIQPYQFHRVVQLGDAVDVERVEARLEHGLLTIVAPKAEHAKSRTIHVQAIGDSQGANKPQKQIPNT